MSRLEELIKELCPDGVEYKHLFEIGSFFGGLSGKSREDFVDGNVKFISYMNVYSNIAVNLRILDFVRVGLNERQNPVQFGDILLTGSSETVEECGFSSVITEKPNEPIYLNSFCFGLRLYKPNLLLPSFSKYLFRSSEVRKQIIRTASGVTRFNVSKKKMEQVLIPLPPLPVQEEIVRILDKFTALEAELEAELEARKKQYEYFLDWLLEADTNVEWRTLGSSTIFIRNGYPYAADGDRNKKYKVARIETISRGKIDMTKVGSVNEVDLRFQMHEGDILFSHINSLPQLGNTAYYEEKYGDLYHGMNLLCLRAKPDCIMPKYLYYLLNSYFIRSCILRNAKHACNQYSLSISDINGWAIPVPAHAIQARIVSILDRFDALVNDITQGLPAELAARRRQYEYYRDKLLTFKEKVS